MSFLLLHLVLVTIILTLVYRWLRWKLERKLTKHGFKFVSLRKLHSYKEDTPACSSMDNETLAYTYFKNAGLHIGATIEAGLQQPVLYVTDTSLARRIMVADSEYFVDRRSLYEPEMNPLFARMLSFLHGEEWARLRRILTPAFSPARMKEMFPLFIQNCDQLVAQIGTTSRLNGRVDIHETIGRFTMDVISSAAFGVEAGSQDDKDSIIYKMGTQLQVLTLKTVVARIAAKYVPAVAKFFKLSTFDPGALHFFAGVTKEMLEKRRGRPTGRKDLLQILLGFHEEGKLSEEDVISQAVLFYFLGFDTLNTFLEICCVVLAKHCKIQGKLREEVKSVFESNFVKNGLDYGALAMAEMPYMAKFIAETLRRYPPTSRTERTCTKDYRIPGTPLIIPARTQVVLPIYAFHTDPSCWGEDAGDINPERGCTDQLYFPFGTGPRSCLGKRFAMDLSKTALAYILDNFEIRADLDNVDLSSVILQRAGTFKLKKGTFLKFNSTQLSND